MKRPGKREKVVGGIPKKFSRHVFKGNLVLGLGERWMSIRFVVADSLIREGDEKWKKGLYINGKRLKECEKMVEEP